MGTIASDERIAEVLLYAHRKGDKQTCETFNLKEDTLRRYKNIYKKQQEIKEGVHWEETPNSLHYVVQSRDIRTLEELIDYCKIDMTKWTVTKFVCNSWIMADYVNWQTKAWFAPIIIKADPVALLREFMEEAKGHAPSYKKIKYVRTNTGNMLEVSIPDLHHGLLSWGKETAGSDYDIKISRTLFLSAVTDLISHAKNYQPKQIILPIGNDFFNVNSMLKTTAKGTPQDEDCRFQKSYLTGFKMAVEGIDRLSLIAPVQVIIIPGNHDLERAYYLGHALECWYHNNPNVEIDNRPTTRKYIQWGACLIGYTHGHEIKQARLPLLMATECPEMWAKTKYREWHLGHLHHQKMSAWIPVAEENGVRARILPSLAAASIWEATKGYLGLKEAQAFIWHNVNGMIANFAYHPRLQKHSVLENELP